MFQAFSSNMCFFWNSNKYVYTYLQDFRCWHQIALSHKPPQKAAETTKESDKEIMGRFRTLRIHQVCPKEGDLYLKSYTHQKLTFSHQKTWMVGLVVCFLVGVCLFSGTLREGIGTLNLHWLGTVFRKHWGAPLPSDALDFAMPRSGEFWMKGLCKMICYTLQGTNISSKKSILKMIFLFPRWDMLIPWRVYVT